MNFDLTAEQQGVQELARGFAKKEVAPIARQMDEEGRMPAEIIQRMGEIGLLRGPVPTEYGGGGWDHVSLALAFEELGRVDSSVRGLMTVHTSLVSQCLLLWASEEQKQAYLPQLASGRMIGCYCLTEPEAGSDAASIETEAIEANGEHGLNGEKIWITNGGIADRLLDDQPVSMLSERGRQRHLCPAYLAGQAGIEFQAVQEMMELPAGLEERLALFGR